MASFLTIEVCSELAKGFSISSIEGINIHSIRIRSREWMSRSTLVDEEPGVTGVGCLLRSSKSLHALSVTVSFGSGIIPSLESGRRSFLAKDPSSKTTIQCWSKEVDKDTIIVLEWNMGF